ncbi:hypothetical protein CFIMG_008543RA00001 [Ceratocystis fimbriata CBS 114723]|uniref:Extracellular serine-rich protein n=1 Tax=Ceratocystis fimbriata CBS 114723 TaxID=1035309 RepID=A0A2C5X1H9_9PEZI|nr:hypothetical protein CFIMG_008543RA00001 [Ceratocystis fimbriata CBS 114723]
MQFKLVSSLMLAVATTSVLAAPSTEIQEPAKIVVKLSAYGFQPPNIEAKVGDLIEFHFGEGTSSVVQSDFENPCKALKNGFSSGTFNVETTKTHDNEDPHIFVVPVTSTDPIAFYNGIKNQCYGYGIVGVINGQEDTEQTHDKLKAKAFESFGISENPNLVHGGIIEANPKYDEFE